MACENAWWWGFLSGAAMFTAAAITGMIAGMAKEPVQKAELVQIDPKKEAV